MSNCYNFDRLISLSPKELKKTKDMAVQIFSIPEERLAELVNEVIDSIRIFYEAGDEELLLETLAVFFHESVCYLSQIRSLRNSELYHFLRVLNHVPILAESPFYTETLNILSKYFKQDPSIVKLFDKLQNMYLFEELGYIEGAKALAKELKSKIDDSNLHLYTLFQICLFRLMPEDDWESRLDLALNLLYKVYHQEGPECSIFLIIEWLKAAEALKHSPIYKALLKNLYKLCKHDMNLNSASIGYELFELSNKLVSPEEKLEIYNELILYPSNILNSLQLRSLHFFAGNYLSGKKEKFRLSINSFISSNYYLHKCWERLVEISKYVRTHSTPIMFKNSVVYLEAQFLNLSHYTSIRNNCYVENLQTSFEEIEKLYREMEELSLTDSLTGLKNRRYKEINLLQMISFASRQGSNICFVMGDLDHFKRVNDDYCHEAGDMVLKELSRLMLDEFRKSDVIIRYGGEEFLIILFSLEQCAARDILEGFRQKVDKQVFIYDHQEISISISFGYYCRYFSNRHDEDEVNKCINYADLALIKAKETGRNKVCAYIEPTNNPA